MNKTKAKITIFLFLTSVGLIAGFFFSGLVNLALTGDFKNISGLAPHAIWNSIMTSDRHRLLFFCIELFIVAGISVLLLMNKRETFESDVSRITETIQTPIAIGQGQHGSARWLKKSEQRRVFSIYRYNKDDAIIRALMLAGQDDRKEVKIYAETAEKESFEPNE